MLIGERGGAGVEVTMVWQRYSIYRCWLLRVRKAHVRRVGKARPCKNGKRKRDGVQRMYVGWASYVKKKGEMSSTLCTIV
jgi:hypothetical protein